MKTSSKKLSWPVIAGFVSLIVFTFLSEPHLTASEKERSVSGIVKNKSGPIANAVVRIQTKEFFCTTDISGRFTLAVPAQLKLPIKITAWSKGFYCGGPVEVSSFHQNLEIELTAHPNVDNKGYGWLPSTSSIQKTQKEKQACSNCHSSKNSTLEYPLPVDEWIKDAHSQSATNPRFLTMYNGTDTKGRSSPVTRYAHERDYGSIPLPAVKDETYFGPGYKLDFPASQGNCGCCHTPLAAINTPYEADPNNVTDLEAEGISCDFCHKIWEVRLDPFTKLPYPNAPGVLSYNFLRPPPGQHFFAGPLDDVAPGQDTYLPLQKESAFCAGCHFGVFWDTVIYNSYGEWLASPYSDPKNTQTCQSCHMPSKGYRHFALPQKGGLERNPAQILTHKMTGVMDRELLSSSVTMQVDAKFIGRIIKIDVTVVNDQTGHHVPTGSPLRHVILLVRAEDKSRRAITFRKGPSLPDWCGIGDISQGCYAGLPGKVFAKVLEEKWTRVSPTASYWNPVRIVSDNRLAAFSKDTSTYYFSTRAPRPVTIDVSLLYRRAYLDLMRTKGWDNPDILMEKQRLTVKPE